MSIKFFDSNFCAGSSEKGSYRPASSGEDVLRELDRLRVKNALVWHVAQREVSVPAGNKLLDEIIAGGANRLKGAWALLPPQTGEQEKPPAFFDSMKKGGACALRIFPEFHKYLPGREVFGSLLDEVADRRIPVFVSVAGKDITWEGLYKLLSDYPRLVLVICSTGIWGADRYFRPLVENYPGVRVETSLVSLGVGVTEAFVRDYGHERLLFGSGFPWRLPESAILQLTHADITENEKKAIACGNIEKLIAEAVL
jgi:uncharacterized protein